MLAIRRKDFSWSADESRFTANDRLRGGDYALRARVARTRSFIRLAFHACNAIC